MRNLKNYTEKYKKYICALLIKPDTITKKLKN